MKVTPTEIPDVVVIEPDVFGDNRGYFFESYSKAKFDAAGIHADFVQDNQSLSCRNVLRGLHFQNPPFEQGKLVRVISGSVLDVAVDIRKGSPYFGKWISRILSAENKAMMWVPPGFAHGFLTLDDNTVFSYKCTAYYRKDAEGVILWNDPVLNIQWGCNDPVVSGRDQNASGFTNFYTKFTFK